jgi:pimeloyl-ACP methyl ester carboxylesterase
MWWYPDESRGGETDAGVLVGASGTRELTVTADDGVALHVELDEAPNAEVTVVFCHGYLLSLEGWLFQRAALAGRARLVLWDQRGHGRSGWNGQQHATIEQLGRDLAAVVEVAAPSGPVVLVGHSMGAMTILALASARPDLFTARVAGALLCSGSAGDLAGVTADLPAPVARMVHWLIPPSLAVLGWQPQPVDVLRRSAGVLSMLLTRRFLFASSVSPAVTALTTRLMATTPIDAIAGLWPQLLTLDARAALPLLGQVPTSVLVGDRDRITPVAHSAAIAAAVPGAELVVLPDAGHLAPLERPDQVNQQLLRLLGRAGYSVCVAA